MSARRWQGFAMKAFAYALAGRSATDEMRRDFGHHLQWANCEVHQFTDAMPEERMLYAVGALAYARNEAECYSLLQQAVGIAARAWAKRAAPGTPEASASYWWQDQ